MQQWKQKTLKSKERKERLSLEPAMQIVHTRSFGNKNTLSRYQEHGKYKRSARGTVAISDKMMAKLGIH